jgi:hypothetical protein
MDFTLKNNNKMNIYAHHDHKGSIKSIVVVTNTKNAGLMLTPKGGLLVTEIEGIKFKSKKPSLNEMQQILKTYKVSAPGKKGRLEKK